MSGGKEFHNLGAITRKELQSARDVGIGIMKAWERCLVLYEWMSATRIKLSAIYLGTSPFNTTLCNKNQLRPPRSPAFPTPVQFREAAHLPEKFVCNLSRRFRTQFWKTQFCPIFFSLYLGNVDLWVKPWKFVRNAIPSTYNSCPDPF